MCTAPNLSSWNLSRCSTIGQTAHSLSNISSSAKPKLSNYHMLILNNLNKHEERNFNDGMQSKYFLSPLRTFQLTPQECNEILIKRASSHHTVTTDDSRSISNGNLQNTINDNLQNQKTSVDFPNTKLRPYSCMECGKTFIQKHHLTTHRKVHSGIRPHTCNYCGKAFTHKHCLNTHLLLHSSNRPYQCSECKKSFTLKHHLISHAKVHSREKPFVCTDCGCAFPLKRHLVTHNKFHAGERPFVCDECGESFAHKDHLVMHSRFHGSTNSFACHECGATFTRKFELVNHSRLHGHVPLSCPVCNKEFMQKRTLIVHMRVHSGETPFHCQICGEGFHLRNQLTVHVATHNTAPSNTQGKLLPCTDCGSSFSNPEALALHIKLHSGDASFVNDLCTLTANLQGANFPIHNNIKIDTQISNNNKTENAVVPTIPVKIKSHICKFCSKAFSAKHGLQQHNKRHPEGTCTLKSHICDICRKAFYQKNHLLLHQRQHMDPTLRNQNYSKMQSDIKPNSPNDNKRFYDQSQDSSTNLLSSNTKVLIDDESNSNGNITNKRDNYLTHYEGYSLSKFKVTRTQTENDDEQCSSALRADKGKGAFNKSGFLQQQQHYHCENLRNIDVKMHISGEIIDDISCIKGENTNFASVG